MIRKSMGLLVATMVLSACVTERVIVREPYNPNAQNGTLQVAGDNNDNGDWGIRGPDAVEYEQVVQKVASMVSDSRVTSGASRRSLGVMNVMWEDTASNLGIFGRPKRYLFRPHAPGPLPRHARQPARGAHA